VRLGRLFTGVRSRMAGSRPPTAALRQPGSHALIVVVVSSPCPTYRRRRPSASIPVFNTKQQAFSAVSGGGFSLVGAACWRMGLGGCSFCGGWVAWLVQALVERALNRRTFSRLPAGGGGCRRTQGPSPGPDSRPDLAAGHGGLARPPRSALGSACGPGGRGRPLLQLRTAGGTITYRLESKRPVASGRAGVAWSAVGLPSGS